jgi:hypothetical protein
MDSSARTFGTLRAFRDSFNRSLDRRANALFEPTDALLTASSVPSPRHLSLAAVHRCGWGSLYAALSKGRTDEGRLRDLLAPHTVEVGGPGDYPSTPWTSRCDRDATRRRAPSEGTTTSAATPPASLSSTAEPTSWSPGSASPVTAWWRP